MPRPAPLQNLATGRPQRSDYQSLTPRTPHSRAGRAEEALGDIELEQLDDDDDHNSHRQQQSEPLLASSSSAGFPPSGLRSRGDDHNISRKSFPSFAAFGKHIPLVLGVVAAFVLFIMILISYKTPEVLLKAVGGENWNVEDKGSPSTSKAADIAVQSSTASNINISDPNIISYENYTDFPLRPVVYRAECDKLMHGFMPPKAYWGEGLKDVPHREEIDEHGLPEGYRNAVCKSTVTYQMGGHAGLMADLGLMAQVAALARERNRTFFVDDTYWNRGKWTDHFQDVRARQPGPEPGCRAPPPEELVACPRSARHWVVNARTAKFHLGHGFSDQYQDPYSHELNRLKPIYNSSFISLTETIRPNAKNAALIRSTREELASILAEKQPNDPHYIGVHIRRGDRHPSSWRYKEDYIPTPEYVQAVHTTSLRLSLHPEVEMLMYIASDSPSAKAEFAKLLPSDTNLFSLSQSRKLELQTIASPREYVQHEFDDLEQEDRVKLTRGMIVDFAMLSGIWAWESDVVPKATVCTITSNICKLSAVGLGWDRAFGTVNDMGLMDEKTKGWVEIDNGGQIAPVWEAFELFT